MNIRHFLILLAFTILGGQITLCHGATETLTGNEEGFWDGRSVVVGRVLSVSESNSSVIFELQVKGVVTTDIYIPMLISVSYIKSRNSPLLTFDVATNGTYMICLEQTAGQWTIPPIRTSLFETGITAAKIIDENDPTIKRLQTQLIETKKSSIRKSASIPNSIP